ncbi:MAG TPA: ATP-binding protein [Burkholderiales bacterium]|nr:ATP-binding protein [Burkholderiales bacterium]
MTRFPLRAKLALTALVLLVLPWAGWLYVREMERFLLAAQEEALAATARAVATALHERPKLLAYRARGESDLRDEAERELRRLTGGVTEEEMRSERARERDSAPDGEIDAILKGLERGSSRIWVVSRGYRVLALAGSLKRADLPEPSILQRTLGWLLAPPTEEFDDTIAEDAVAAGREVAAALQGAASTRTRATRDGRAVIVSAAHPIWVGDEVQGAVVVEETTNRIASLRSQALERLLVATLAAFGLAAAALLWFATRISNRIRRLAGEAEAAIDARGRVTRLTTASDAADEIGDLSRSFTTVLERLARYNAYLEALAGRLSHELRTPVAVVRSSLENLHAARTPEETRTYLARAEDGLARLGTILARMTEASRLEQGLSAAARERFDAAAVVRGCVEGYRLAYDGRAQGASGGRAQGARGARSFELALPGEPVPVQGAPDLLAQMLDKLVENAVDFAVDGTAIRISLSAEARLRVENQGPPLPEAIRDSLFDSMVSQRGGPKDGAPHLGLGLYIARLIAEFHGGRLVAENLPGGTGVAFEARLARAA